MTEYLKKNVRRRRLVLNSEHVLLINKNNIGKEILLICEIKKNYESYYFEYFYKSSILILLEGISVGGELTKKQKKNTKDHVFFYLKIQETFFMKCNFELLVKYYS